MSLNIKKLWLPEGQATEITREFGRIYDIGGIEDNHITPEYLSNVLTLSKWLFDEKRLGYLSNNIEKFALKINPNRILHIHASFHYDELLKKKLTFEIWNKYNINLLRECDELFSEALKRSYL